MQAKASPARLRGPARIGRLRDVLGPGLVTGAADDDPSGVATYSQAGAQFGFGTLWTMVLTYPLMAAVQLVSGRIGRVTGLGIAGNMRRVFPAWASIACIGAMVGANTVNIAADVAAMGAAVKLAIGGPAAVYAVALGAASLGMQVFLPYRRYVRYLKWLTLALFAYVAAAFVVQIPWAEALRHTWLPSFPRNSGIFTVVAAIFGTTISPYLLFWQASQEVEEVRRVRAAQPLVQAPAQAPAQLKRIEVDTWIGMGFSNVVGYFIILTTAATLHVHGRTDIRTAADAAEALRPIAGPFASGLFGLGIVGTGLLALPVLGGSAAYAISEAMHWKEGLGHPLRRARKFYAVLTLVLVAGLAFSLVPVDPMKGLFWAAVLNGLVSPPLMAVLMIIASRRVVMKSLTLPRWLKIGGWTATALMFAVAGLSLADWFSAL